ncbi:MAG: hypothetical protein C3F17_20410 [Bradyrhizobiaceae bacterium]|nr:MAG: hypothetical protein C3F17_20410 [Bradyrhizobiaceae bacterium]
MPQEDDLKDLYAWLSTQHNGLKTYNAFHSKALQLAREQQQNAAVLHLLAMLAERFISSYDESPLPVGVADRAFARLKQLVQKSTEWERTADADKIALLNEIACTELG